VISAAFPYQEQRRRGHRRLDVGPRRCGVKPPPTSMAISPSAMA
jgi:hypothetical protein